MSRLFFQARIELATATAGANDTWELSFKLVDNEGRFRVRDVSVDDVVVLDTGPVETGTLTRYRINTVVNTSWDGTATVIAEYEADNDNATPNPDLGFVVGRPGIIARPTTHHRFVPLISPSTQQLSDRFSFYLQNYNNLVIDKTLHEGVGSDVTLVTKTLLVNQDGYLVLPETPKGDLIWNTVIVFLEDDSAVEFTEVTWSLNPDGLPVIVFDPDDIAFLHAPISRVVVSYLGTPA